MIESFSSTLAALVLYIVTLAAQCFAAFARVLMIYIVLAIVKLFTGLPIPADQIALVVAILPLVVSLLALIVPPLVLPIDGRWWEISSGGRAPDRDEYEAFDEAIGQLQDIDPNLRVPKHWFVAEEASPNAGAYANSLSVNRGLLEGPYATAVIAHELGHLHSSDARLSSALNLLLVARMDPPEAQPAWSLPFRLLAWFASGQAAMWFTENAWQSYWRSREYAADAYAARLGQAASLGLILEHNSLPFERSIRRMSFSRATHPYTKQRIARLRSGPGQAGAAARIPVLDAPETSGPVTAPADTEVTHRSPSVPEKPASDYDRLLQRLGANFG
jgi:Zn-dependent protease with chaperone function